MLIVVWFFFFKQKTAYEWRISDWSSDVCSSDLRPDAILILGDTNSALAAIPAKRRRIPIFHMEAGNRCFDQRVPEEINRVIVDHIADMNLTYSDIAREMLLRAGLPPDRVVKTGRSEEHTSELQSLMRI